MLHDVQHYICCRFDTLDRNYNFHRGRIIIECALYSENHALLEKCIRAAFWDVEEFRFEPSEGDSDSPPEIWKIIGPVELQEKMDLGRVVLIATLNLLSH